MADLTKELIKHLEGITKCGVEVQGTNHKKIFVPDGINLTSIEKMNKYRDRFRGTMGTMSIDSFSDYVAKFSEKTAPPSCFVRSQEPVANVIFDIGDIENPEHCEHQAKLSLRQTADYARVLSVNSNELTQYGMAAFMEDYAHCLKAVDAEGEPMDIPKAILAVRRVTIDANSKSEHQVNQLSTTRSALEQITATSNGEPLPAWVTFTCAPYLGLSDREFPMRLALGESRDSAPRLTLTIADLEGIQEKIQEEFKDLVSSKMPEDVNTYIGNFES